jgi:fatty acid desaturase
MFIPMGGIFVFGTGSPMFNTIAGLFNLLGAAMLLFCGYAFGIVAFLVIGYIVLALGAAMVLFNVFKLGRGEREGETEPIIE